jgi:hypothetical protein
VLAGVAVQYVAHWLQVRREQETDRRSTRREADARLRAALQPWVACTLDLMDATRAILSEPGLDPPILAATKQYESGRAAVAMEPGGDDLEKRFRKLVRTAHLLRGETHEVFRLIEDTDHLAGGAAAEYWREEKDKHHDAEERLRGEVRDQLQAFLTAVRDRFGDQAIPSTGASGTVTS